MKKRKKRMKKVILFLAVVLLVTAATACSSDSKLTAKFSVKNITVEGLRIGDPTDSRFESTDSGEKAYAIAESSATYAIDSDGDEIIDTLRVLIKEGEPGLMIGGKNMKTLDDFYGVLGEPFIEKETTMQVGDERACYAEYINDEEMARMTVYYFVNRANNSIRVNDVLLTVLDQDELDKYESLKNESD